MCVCEREREREHLVYMCFCSPVGVCMIGCIHVCVLCVCERAHAVSLCECCSPLGVGIFGWVYVRERVYCNVCRSPVGVDVCACLSVSMLFACV